MLRTANSALASKNHVALGWLIFFLCEFPCSTYGICMSGYGHYVDQCTICEVGKWTPENLPVSSPNPCIPCAAGKYVRCHRLKPSPCINCNAGTSSLPGTTADFVSGYSNCFSCPTGKVNKEAGGTRDDCSVGKYMSTTGNLFCTPCESGKFQNETGKSICKTCDQGIFTDSAGRESCDT